MTFREQSTGLTAAVSAGVKIGKDSVIGYGVQIYGKTTIGRCCSAPVTLPTQSDEADAVPLVWL